MNQLPKSIILAAFICTLATGLHAAALPRGDDRLRELVVFPKMDFNFNWQLNLENNEWHIEKSVDLPETIAQQRGQLKHHPDDIKQLMQLGHWLNQAGETNESESCYAQAAQLCRQKIAANPQDGLSLTALGVTLAGDHNEEAEKVFRQATQVSSNEWRCWIGLGNFLPNKDFSAIFPTNWQGKIGPGQPIPQAVLDYRPSAESLNRAEANCREASRCFDRALALAPQEPEVFLQRAGFAFMSNWQSNFFRHYRDNEPLTANAGVLSLTSPEMIADLKKVSELRPKDYQSIGLAIYFELIRAAFQNQGKKFDIKESPDALQKSVHAGVTHLEALSQDPDQAVAAGAYESLGMLNILLENQPEALKDFRQSVALDPTRNQAWDMLQGMLLDSPDEMLVAARAHLKADDSARNHMILSRILAGPKRKYSEAVAEAEMAGKLETNNPVPLMQLTAIALKQSAQTNYLSVAITNIARSYSLIQAMPENDEKILRLQEWLLNMIIYEALTGDLDEARQTVNGFKRRFPDEKTAKALADILN